MLTDILFLFKQYGGSLFLFLLLSFLLGLWLAYLAWRALAHRVAEKQAEYTRLADRVNAMRERRQSLGGPEFKPIARTFAFVDGGGIASTPVDPTAAERKRLEKLAKADFPGENVRIDPALGVLYNEKPEQADDLSLVRGIGPSLEDKLNENGVYRFKQISHWSDDHVAGMANKIETSKDRIQRDRWIPQASELATLSAAEAAPLYHAPERVDHEAKVATAFESEPVHVDPSLGIVYDEKPQFGDDLTAIKDITPEMAATLNSNGVHRYKQMANWSDHNVTEAANKLGINKGSIETDKWVLQARRLHIDTYRPSSSWGIARPSEADYAELIDEEFKGLDVRPDGDLGVLYRSRPENIDDLKEITGIGKVLETELHDLGIYRFKQIGFWSESTIRAMAQKLDIHPEYIYRDEWIPEARRLYLEADKVEAEAAAAAAALAAAVPAADTPLSAASGFSTPAASTRIDPKLGVLYTTRPSGLDDLTQISGVGEIIANKLNDFGVYTFEQVANWTPEQCQEFATVLETFKDRIERDNWVGQAKELLAQKQGLG